MFPQKKTGKQPGKDWHHADEDKDFGKRQKSKRIEKGDRANHRKSRTQGHGPRTRCAQALRGFTKPRAGPAECHNNGTGKRKQLRGGITQCDELGDRIR